MDVIVRQVRADDVLEGLGAEHGEDVDTPRRRRTAVAERDARIVGAGTAWWSNRHPDVVQAFVEVLPAHRRQGIASRLLRAVEELSDRPLLVTVPHGDAAGTGLLRRHGYAPVVESTTKRLDAPLLHARADLLADRAPTAVTIAAAALTPDVVALFETVYAERHTWAGTYVPQPPAPWIAMAGELLPSTLFVAADGNGRLIGASCLVVGHFADGADAFVPPTGLLAAAAHPDPTALVAALLVRSLDAARQLGVTCVNVEFDSPYDELTAIAGPITSAVVNHSTSWMRTGPTTTGSLSRAASP